MALRPVRAGDRAIRAAGLRALARVDEPSARRIAVGLLGAGTSGRMLWAATDVLRRRPPSDGEIEALVPVALDRRRPAGHRFRALGLIRRSRWVHLATLLQVRDADRGEIETSQLDHEINVWLRGSGHIGRRPTGRTAEDIDRLLPSLDTERRARVEFILRTTR